MEIKDITNAPGGQSLTNGGGRTAAPPEPLTLTPENIASINQKNTPAPTTPEPTRQSKIDSINTGIEAAQEALNKLRLKNLPPVVVLLVLMKDPLKMKRTPQHQL